MKAVFLAMSLAASGLSAQTLKSIDLDMAQAQTGQIVTATIGLDAGATANCGLRVHWGDGAVNEIRVQDPKQIPVKVSHGYARPGDYPVVADAGKVKSSMACVGKKITAMVKVVAPPPPPVPVAAPAVAPAARSAAGPSCPDNWRLNPKSVVRSTGAYTCSARRGTATPDQRPECPGDLTYFENSKKGMLGCRA